MGVQPRRHHHQAQREDPDHRGRRPRGAFQAEARDPRQHRPGRHVLLLLLRRSPRDQGSKDEVNSEFPLVLNLSLFSFYITCSHQMFYNFANTSIALSKKKKKKKKKSTLVDTTV